MCSSITSCAFEYPFLTWSALLSSLLSTSQHIDTPDNTVETKFDFNEENYKRVEMVCFYICFLVWYLVEWLNHLEAMQYYYLTRFQIDF